MTILIARPAPTTAQKRSLRVPRWLPRALGRYCMYLTRHQGTYIRLAYADRLEEPWTARRIGTIRPAMSISRRLTYMSSNVRGSLSCPCFFEKDGQAHLSVRCGASRLSAFISYV